MSGPNIKNSKSRAVICVDNKDHTWGGCDFASKFLEVGKVYHVDRREVHDWHTRIYLEEFPDRWFNSVAFNDF